MTARIQFVKSLILRCRDFSAECPYFIGGCNSIKTLTINLSLSPTYPGSVHDKKIYGQEALRFEKKTIVFVDLGFIGLTSETIRVVNIDKNGHEYKLQYHIK